MGKNNNKLIPEIGDIIVIESSGATYTTYDAWAHDNGLTNWDRGQCPQKDGKYKIVCFSTGEYLRQEIKNGDSRRMGIESLEDGKQYIFVRDAERYGGPYRIEKKASKQLKFMF